MTAKVTNISAHQFQQQYDQAVEKLYIIDLRSHAEVEHEYLEGCSHFPVQTLDTDALHILLDQRGHQPDQPIYLLCANGPRATLAADKLKHKSTSELVIISGGLNALKALGVSLISGASQTISLERQVRIAAGSLVVIGVLLGLVISPWFYSLSGFVGAGLVFAGVTDTCGMGILLARMPWNTRSGSQ
jgi:rhodanese-related sulfurtransferase